MFIEKLVFLTQRVHPFPFRTRKLSFAVPKILVWRRTGKIGQRWHKVKQELDKQSVILTQRVHPFPFRTRKLSFAVPKILVWRRTGKIGHSRHRGILTYPFIYSSLAQSVDDRAKQLSVVLRREIAKTRSFEAEQAQASKTTMFSGVSMKCARTTERGWKNTDLKIRYIPP